MQKSHLFTLAVLSLLLAACSSTTTSDQSSSSSTDLTESSSAMMDTSSSSEAAMQNSSSSSTVAQQTSSVSSVVATTRTIEVDVANFAFSPTSITAKKGEKVRLKLVGMSGTHGFAAPDLGINVRVAPGDSVMVDLPTDTAGSFNAFCNVPCGPGHRDMKATIVIS